MSDAVLILLKGLDGGIFVVLFSLLGEMTKPKRFSGIFSAAPSVAIANLLVTVLAEGEDTARVDLQGMVVGGVAMIICCSAAAGMVPKRGAVVASVIICVVWLLVALPTWVVAFP